MEAAQETFEDAELRRCLRNIKAQVQKAGNELLKDEKLVSECHNFVRWTAQLPILQFNLAWTNFLGRLRQEWDETAMADYLAKNVLFRRSLDLSPYLHKDLAVQPPNAQYPRMVWDAYWRGHWDAVTPGYGGYTSNVQEGGWSALKSLACAS